METHAVFDRRAPGDGRGEGRKAGHQLRVSFQSPDLTFLDFFFFFENASTLEAH